MFGNELEECGKITGILTKGMEAGFGIQRFRAGQLPPTS